MQSLNLDFTNTLRDLGDLENVKHAYYQENDFQSWLQRWMKRLQTDGQSPGTVSEQMNQRNPCYIARNHKVEEALVAAETSDNLEPFMKLLAALKQPYSATPELSEFRTPASAKEQSCYRTYCGT